MCVNLKLSVVSLVFFFLNRGIVAVVWLSVAKSPSLGLYINIVYQTNTAYNMIKRWLQKADSDPSEC